CQGEPVAVPWDDGGRLDDHQRAAPVSPALCESHPKESVARPEATSLRRAAEGRQCCRRARFSKTNSRWPRKDNVSARTTTMSSSNMRRSWPASMRKINTDEFWRASRAEINAAQFWRAAARRRDLLQRSARRVARLPFV